MRGMDWSWDDLENTPVYVRRYCSDFLSIEGRLQSEARERAKRQHGG